MTSTLSRSDYSGANIAIPTSHPNREASITPAAERLPRAVPLAWELVLDTDDTAVGWACTQQHEYYYRYSINNAIPCHHQDYS